MAAPARRLVRPTLFICDLQEKFRSAIHEFPKVVSTTQKLLKASQILDIPVFATTQLRGKLGETCPELGLDAEGGIKTKAHVDKEGHKVYVIADAVSSCNPQEVPIALARLRAEGAIVTTSESFMYECMGDAGIAEFKGIAGTVKEWNQATKENLSALCSKM
ncbi:hypothetical protein D0867_14950 [Hortaea werneckii]|uniref:Isochorismatase-like domain-containing protein n=1 Tax=Hortaea werneckii TaxID=91943 RepID=A0A3M6XKX2_HORWE|nr:hypothetical protein D0867_14950 [Hortaea werneckii]